MNKYTLALTFTAQVPVSKSFLSNHRCVCYCCFNFSKDILIKNLFFSWARAMDGSVV